MKIGILGAGSWGTALAVVLSENHEIDLWVANQERADRIRLDGENRFYLPGVSFNENISTGSDLAVAVDNEVVIVAVPVRALREVLSKIRKLIDRQTILISTCKGLESESNLFPHQIFEEILPENDLALLSGPNFAIEVARFLPTASMLASKDKELVLNLIQNLELQTIRLYPSCDVFGIEICAAVKNVIAVASGLSDGLNMGENARAALITRGLAEAQRLMHAMGLDDLSLMSLAGVGDFFLTCSSNLSRNYRVGRSLAANRDLKSILADLGQISEGANSAMALNNLALKLKVELPITATLCQIMDGHLKPSDCVESLLNRRLRLDF